MDPLGLVLFLVIGLIAGWVASKVVRGQGMDLIGSLVVGCVGAFIGPGVLRLVGLNAGGLIGDLITATIGAIVLLVVVGVLKRV